MERLKISANGRELVATLTENSSTKALKELIVQRGGSLEVKMSDYGDFEKVGSLGVSLPTSNSQITTTVGDIMLYQGNSIVIFYDSNSWSYTRLGRIENATRDSLLALLGSGSVTATLSIIE